MLIDYPIIFGSICFPSDPLINFKGFCWSDTICFDVGDKEIWGSTLLRLIPAFRLRER